MGHTYHEVFGTEAAARDASIVRLLALRKELEHIPLAEFSAGDLPSLLRVMTNRYGDPNTEDMERLEQKVKEFSMTP